MLTCSGWSISAPRKKLDCLNLSQICNQIVDTCPNGLFDLIQREVSPLPPEKFGAQIVNPMFILCHRIKRRQDCSGADSRGVVARAGSRVCVVVDYFLLCYHCYAPDPSCAI